MDAYGKIIFRFDGINLPGSGQDESQSHGWVTYEVMPKMGLDAGNLIYNTAQIYFDFNAPIVTNTVVTELVDLLALAQNATATFSMFPNPANALVTVQAPTQQPLAVRLLDLQGKEILRKDGQDIVVLDVSGLQKGLYLVTIESADATVFKKLIVN